MSLEGLLIFTFRLIGSLPVLRWPLWGGLLAILVDLLDLALMTWLDLGGLADYQRFDKIADLGYMLLFLRVAMRWDGLERRIAIWLFSYRMLGLIAFELTGLRPLLLAFPNVFELWFLFVAARQRFWSQAPVLSVGMAAMALLPLSLLKLAQEWLLHIDRRLDQYTLPEFIDMLMEQLPFG